MHRLKFAGCMIKGLVELKFGSVFNQILANHFKTTQTIVCRIYPLYAAIPSANAMNSELHVCLINTIDKDSNAWNWFEFDETMHRN